MKIFIIEDNIDKLMDIQVTCTNLLDADNVSFELAKSLSTAVRLLSLNSYDLIIVDLYVPHVDNGAESDVGKEIIKIISQSELNNNAYVIALSGYLDLVNDQKAFYESQGILLLYYDAIEGNWKKTFESTLPRIRNIVQLDFVIICALEEEREAYRNTESKCGVKAIVQGLDYQKIEIEGANGACVLLPKMGLVDASIITSRCLEVFNPRLAIMTGICGGFVENCTLGQLLIADQCWEYQSGKWSVVQPKNADDKVESEFESYFEISPLQISLTEQTRLILNSMISQENIIEELESSLRCDRPSKFSLPAIAPFTSGSAVIADKTKLEEVIKQHRKVAGLDMEMYGFYRSIALAKKKDTIFFGAKTVVDMGDPAKGDIIHEYGATVSARFAVKAIKTLLSADD